MLPPPTLTMWRAGSQQQQAVAAAAAVRRQRLQALVLLLVLLVLVVVMATVGLLCLRSPWPVFTGKLASHTRQQQQQHRCVYRCCG